MQNLQGKIAFVTGGASGIGLGMTHAFLAEGMKVMVADVRRDHLEAAQSQLGPRDDVRFVALDVTDRQAMASAAAETERAFGKVHLLCNNAGVGIMAGGKNASYDDWDWSIGVNLTGVFNGVHVFLPYILKHGEGGHIVNTASVAAVLPSNIVYASAKCAVMGLSEGLRAELAADDVGVTCLLAGPTATNIQEVAALRSKQYQNTSLGAFEAEMSHRPINPNWMKPRRVGELIVDAVRRNLLFVFTHNEHKPGVAKRFEAILAAFPSGTPDPDGARKLGFRIANPMYEEMLALGQPPAGHGGKRQS
ncbi:MAG TPA: SDR family NAD(P)-dependent oxidoreductase [Steroidobacteraceae bacterium]|nr:SDR family NAD(P)-dependent oxidoreductase [Steroidobacteraceae bacterium]